ncbi:MAG: hypothetical protein K6G13_08880 [Agathobacter sp.]|uniref:hypothetical protein n=1 Tax=Agathobacter sp. TaxID=2021311 RepID=UPI002587F561|nr:hypothetical protein [Agathobacter sp.]MCR5678129.1 hypothetical protein [Agathobacter sp.]
MSDKKTIYLHIVSMDKIGNHVFFKSVNVPGTFCLENGTNLVLLDENEDKGSWCPYQYSDCVHIDHTLLFVPCDRAPFITLYHVDTKTFEYIKNEGQKKYKIGIPCGDKIYLFGEHLDGDNVAVVDPVNHEIKELHWSSENEQPAITYHNYSRMGNKLLFPNFGYGKLCEYDLDNQTSRIIEISEEIAPSSVLVDEDIIWITGNKDEIHVYGKEDFSLHKIIKLPERTRDCQWKMRFSASAIMGDDIFFSPVYYGSIIKINRLNMAVETVYELEEDEICWSINTLDENHLYFDVYNFVTAEVGNIVVSSTGEITKNDHRFIGSNLYFRNELYESSINSLVGYLDFVRRNENEIN